MDDTRFAAWRQIRKARRGQVRAISAIIAVLCLPLADLIAGANFRAHGGRSTGVDRASAFFPE